MDPRVTEWFNLIFRWAHLAAGVMWIGHLWFFNFVNSQLAKTYDPDSKKKVLPELMPRALYGFGWGAAYTFITGILLLLLVYGHGGLMVEPDLTFRQAGVGAVGLVIIFVGSASDDCWWNNMQ